MPNAQPRRTRPNLSHGAERLPTLSVTAYSADLRDDQGFVGDRASGHAFRTILEQWRARLRKVGNDPLGTAATDAISEDKLDEILREGESEAAGVVHAAVDDFARELAAVAQRFLRLKAWEGAKRVAVGGGLRGSRVGELAIGRASVLLKAAGRSVDLIPIRHHPDHAGLIGAVHLKPSRTFAGFDGVLGVDIGGSNIRAGIVQLHLEKADDLSAAAVRVSKLWRHVDEQPKRAEAVERLVGMLRDLLRNADEEGLSLAPFVGVGCPGVIENDGTIDRGGQNLPGNWEGRHFNLPELIRKSLPKIGRHQTRTLMHNDAVVQGLSEIPFMRDVDRWGVLTIGTGLGNACFDNIPSRP